MATVANKDGGWVAGANRTTDYTLVSANRENGGDPNGVLTPLFSGEIILDTSTKKLWQAQDQTNDSWVEAVRVA